MQNLRNDLPREISNLSYKLGKMRSSVTAADVRAFSQFLYSGSNVSAARSAGGRNPIPSRDPASPLGVLARQGANSTVFVKTP
jgi:hypothetical protein